MLSLLRDSRQLEVQLSASPSCSSMCFVRLFGQWQQHLAAVWTLWQQWLGSIKEHGAQLCCLVPEMTPVCSYILLNVIWIWQCAQWLCVCVCACVPEELLCQISFSYSTDIQYQGSYLKFVSVLQTAGRVMHCRITDSWNISPLFMSLPFCRSWFMAADGHLKTGLDEYLCEEVNRRGRQGMIYSWRGRRFILGLLGLFICRWQRVFFNTDTSDTAV